MSSSGKIDSSQSILFVCDMQEKFRKAIASFDDIVINCSRIVTVSRLLAVPIVLTEQYPKGLGMTIKELNLTDVPAHEKTCFTMLTDEVKEVLCKSNKKDVILCGIETHVCVQVTCLDLLDMGYKVHVLVDGCSSRNMVDRMYAIQRMRDSGAYITTTESVILGLLQDAKHPKFKEVQKIISTVGPSTGLLNNWCSPLSSL